MVRVAVSRTSCSMKKGLITTLQIVLFIIFCSSRTVQAHDSDHEEKLSPIDAMKPRILVCAPDNATGDVEPYEDDDYADYLAIPTVYTINLTIDDDEEAPTPDQRFHILVRDPCPEKVLYPLEPEKYNEIDEYYLLRNGSLFMPRRDPGSQIVGFDKYCFELYDNDTVYIPALCSTSNRLPDAFGHVKYIGALISVPFLIATVIVYSILPGLKNIHGTTLRCYVCCLIVTYVGLAIHQIPQADYNAGVFCLCLGFLIYFSFLASFFWLNVMCIDTCSRFGGIGCLRNSGVEYDRKRFIRYSIYAWGVPAVMAIICIIMEFAPENSDSVFYPGFRMAACWFERTTVEALYFYGPVGLIIACNIGLFVLTTIKMVQYRRILGSQHTAVGDGRRHEDNKHWFGLHLKLFILMGITWSTDIISWLWEEPKYLWYVTDMINALQGILIFVIFVCKKKIWRALREHFKKVSQNSFSDFQTNATLGDKIRNPFLNSKSSSIPSDGKTYVELGSGNKDVER